METDEFDYFQQQLQSQDSEMASGERTAEQERIAALEAELERQIKRRAEERQHLETEAQQLRATLGKVQVQAQAQVNAARAEYL